MTGSKIKDFIAALESGETRESARDISGCSDATSKIQFTRWNKGKNKTKKEDSDLDSDSSSEENPVSPLPGKPLPK